MPGVVCRAIPQNGYADYEAYMAIIDASVPLPGASNLIFYPLDVRVHGSRLPAEAAAMITWAVARQSRRSYHL
jgi:hypothetical protein